MYFNAISLSERSGTGFWRAAMQDTTIACAAERFKIFNTIVGKPILDPKWYENLNSFMVQRLIGKEQRKLYEGFIVPVCRQNNVWTIYNLDDAPHYKDIPAYNRGRWNYAKDETQENIRSMMNASDFVLTTTDYLKGYFHRTYDVPEDNIIAIPNYLPRWWIGNFYDLDKSVNRFRENSRKKLRIGIISSLSHYNIDGIRQDPETKDVIKKFKEKDATGKEIEIWKNPKGTVIEDISKYEEISDDLDTIINVIRKTANDFTWVFLGYSPPKLKDLVESKQIEYHPGVPIVNYPEAISRLKLNFIVAPLQDNEFNRCKSNIKWLESCALGIPLYASNVSTYSKYMPENQLFKDENEFAAILDKIKRMSATVYQDMVARQWGWLNSPNNECGWNSPNWWLEDNLKPWIKLWRMRKKHIVISLANFVNVKKAEIAKKLEKTTKVLSKNGGELEVYI